MSGFHFSLDALLRLQRTLVRLEERQLARLLAQRAALEHRLSDVERQVRRSSEDAQQAALRGTSGAELGLCTALLASYRQVATRIRGDLRCLTPILEQQRARYQAAQREQEKVEKLREKAQAAWQLERSRREQQAADELYLLRRRQAATRA